MLGCMQTGKDFMTFLKLLCIRGVQSQPERLCAQSIIFSVLEGLYILGPNGCGILIVFYIASKDRGDLSGSPGKLKWPIGNGVLGFSISKVSTPEHVRIV